MSYNLSISGHHNDESVADAIDTLVREKGQEIVDAVRELDPAALASASFSGPAGYVNYLAVVEPPADEAAPVDVTDAVAEPDSDDDPG